MLFITKSKIQSRVDPDKELPFFVPSRVCKLKLWRDSSEFSNGLEKILTNSFFSTGPLKKCINFRRTCQQYFANFFGCLLGKPRCVPIQHAQGRIKWQIKCNRTGESLERTVLIVAYFSIFSIYFFIFFYFQNILEMFQK